MHVSDGCAKISSLFFQEWCDAFAWILRFVIMTWVVGFEGYLVQRWNLACDSFVMASRPEGEGHVPKHVYVCFSYVGT